MRLRPKLVWPLLALLPVVILISELDNWTRLIVPPSPEVAELRAQLEELARIDSVYAALQTVIVAVGINPVVEGFLFFGVMLQGLVAHLGRTRGALLTAILYSLVHFPASGAPGDAIVPLASALITGMLLCLARLATDRSCRRSCSVPASPACIWRRPPWRRAFPSRASTHPGSTRQR